VALVLAAAVAAGQDARPLRVSGVLGVPKVDAQQRVSFQLTLTNTSARSLRDISVAAVGGPHVTLQVAGWCRRGTTWDDLTHGDCVVRPSLAPEQSVTVDGVLLAEKPLQANITAYIRWLSVAEPNLRVSVQSQHAFAIGTLTIEDWTVRWMSAASDFALPVVVALVGYLFQRRLNKVEQRRQRDEASRAEKAEAWRLMLPVSHNYAIDHYIGLVNAAELLVKRGQGVLTHTGAADDRLAACREAFFAWFTLYCRLRALQQTGAYYFKNHVGELLVPALYAEFRAAFVQEAPSDAVAVSTNQLAINRLLDQATDGVKPQSTRDEVLSRLALEQFTRGPVAELYGWFERRLQRGGVHQALGYLGAYADILFFELNKPYAHWFEDRQIRLTTTPARLVVLWRMLLRSGDPQLQAIRGEVETYLSQGGINVTLIRQAWFVAQLRLPEPTIPNQSSPAF